MTTLFSVVALLIALLSWLFVSQATAGVAGLCFACFILISTRVAQADNHHKELMARLAGDGARAQAPTSDVAPPLGKFGFKRDPLN